MGTREGPREGESACGWQVAVLNRVVRVAA